MTAVRQHPPPGELAPGRRDKLTRAQLAARRRRLAAFEFAGLLAFQAFHQMEHTLEVVQKRLGNERVSPLLGGVDFEWAHFTGNTLLFLGLVAVVAAYGGQGGGAWRSRSNVAWAVLMGGVIVQGLHVVEHIVRVSQYVATGRLPVGLATQWVDPIWFHFSVNLVFLVALAVGFFGLRIPRDLHPTTPRPRQPSAAR